MPRIAEPRPPAEPSTPPQRVRRDRILAAAARLGAERGLERVQMQEVAHEAGVAVGTLYRYYPSKHLLFAAVMNASVAGLSPPSRLPPEVSPGEAVAELMTQASRAMLRRPRLARAMITSVNVVLSGGTQGAHRMRDLIVRTAGLSDPTEEELRLARLVEQCAYGALTWAVAGESTPEEAEADIRQACLLLLAPLDPPPRVSRAPRAPRRP